MGLFRKLTPDLFLAELALTTDAVIVDVRTSREIEMDPMIQGAVHLDVLDEGFESELEPFDRLQSFFVYCQNGKRGPIACRLMSENGFLLAAYLDGGKTAWDKVVGE